MCGLLASRLPGAAAVRLRAPPPLDTELRVRAGADGVRLEVDGTLVAEARPARIGFEPPPSPGLDAALAASRGYRGFASHWFPSCFVCGPERAEGDGLRVFPGPLDTGERVACAWRPAADLCDGAGAVRPEFLWAAVDCPGAFGFPAPAEGAVLLGELAAEIRAPVRAGEPCVLLSWQTRHAGRKHFTATVLYGASGDWRVRAEGIWLEVPRAA